MKTILLPPNLGANVAPTFNSRPRKAGGTPALRGGRGFKAQAWVGSILTPILMFHTGSALAQGYINFSMRVPGVVVAHVYDHAHIGDAEEGQLQGNTATETPAGTQTYAGAWLTGSGYNAQLWYAVGAGQPESALIPLAGSLTTFRGGPNLGGTPMPLWVVVPGVAPVTGIGTFQVRAWNNAGGLATSWFDASFKGRSAVFEMTNLSDGFLTPPTDMVNVRSFNLTYIPEPAIGALLGLGALGLWFARRGQRHQ